MPAKTTKTLLYFIVYVAFSQVVKAQSATISGTVNDKNGEAIIGTLIVLDNSNLGAVADENGNFYINNVPPGKYLMEITALGFKKIIQTINVSIDEKITIDIVLEEATEELNEVVIVQKSKAEKIREQGYAVAVINTVEQKNLPTDVNQLLKASPGVNIREAGGLGSGFTLSLNGLSGNQIRYFIDGVPMENFGSSLTLNNFPANLIERIEVYK
ncbi:MAG: carboxypeptidase-like regulatory domain-containing protein, partial [Bacteroidota bacterium]